MARLTAMKINNSNATRCHVRLNHCTADFELTQANIEITIERAQIQKTLGSHQWGSFGLPKNRVTAAISNPTTAKVMEMKLSIRACTDALRFSTWLLRLSIFLSKSLNLPTTP